MRPALTILIVGGYGAFGGRIIELLEANPALALIVSGRSMAKAVSFCRSRPNAVATLMPTVFDRNGDIVAQIAALKPDLLIDASGPFQIYGDGPYRVIEGCIAAGVNYLDLADGSAFVAGVGTFDEQAKAAGVYVLSGVSSFPVLTAAAARRLALGMRRVESIRGGVAPSPYAVVGENVIRAVASYGGHPVPMIRNGRPSVGYPLTEQTRYTIAPPGRLPLRNTLFSLMDVPDLRALGDLWPEARDIWMGAGPVPEILHRFLIGLAWLVRWRVVGSLTPLARLMHWATNTLRWGERRGGMFVEVAGQDDALSRIKRSWHLLAEGDEGPLIPSMAATAIVHRILVGRAPAVGARAATRDLELEDYETQFASRAIFTGVRGDDPAGAGLYRKILGDAYDALPGAIRDLHEAASAEGEASVERGRDLLARVAAKLVGFPSPTPGTPVRVRFDRAEGRETWTRTFGGDSFRSEQFAGAGRSDALLVERFGRLEFSMALVVEEAKLALRLRRWTAFGIAMPMRLAPRSEAFESADADGVFRFDVAIRHPLAELIVRYRGWLKPASAGVGEHARPEIVEAT